MKKTLRAQKGATLCMNGMEWKALEKESEEDWNEHNSSASCAGRESGNASNISSLFTIDDRQDVCGENCRKARPTKLFDDVDG